jgi:hypothetical protein
MERMFESRQSLSALSALDPLLQADMLATLAQEARLVRLALSAARSDADHVACSFERALGGVMDADADVDSERARRELVAVLADVRSAGLTVSASIEEMTLDGVLGAQRLPVLTAVLSAA